MRPALTLILVIFFNCALTVAPARATVAEHPLQLALIDFLENHPANTLDMCSTKAESAIIDRALLSLYIKNNMQPLWRHANRIDSRAAALLQTIQQSTSDGLNSDNYKVDEIQTLWSCNAPSSRARLDILLTMALGHYVADMREGSADPRLLDAKLFSAARDKNVDILQVVNDALQSDNIADFLKNQAPNHAAYQGLRKALARFQTMSRQGGWKTIPTGLLITPGMRDSRLPLIAHRLERTGELEKIPADAELYDPELVAAVRKFQHHFRLEPDGIIGKKTLAALNIPASQLTRKIMLNMERWRWLPHRLDEKQIFVNIAGFQLFGTTNEQVEITMPVIVGKVYHKTPVFTGYIRYLEVNPYWNIPNSIAIKEMVPHMQRDPDYLREHHIRIFKGWEENAPEIDPAAIDWQTIGKNIRRYRLRQDPGPENALGRIKFIFPNENNIYLHDTPAHHLFKQTNRTFSHGCIRVSRPLDLASYLLQGNKKPLSSDQLDDLIATNQRKVILLDKKIPVHILYRTVRASLTTDEVFFYPDIYGRDALLAKALFADAPRQKWKEGNQP